jgi:hypothetical protein
MLMAAPSDAASPTKKALRGLPVRAAAAKIGANVETEPSINPRRPGWISWSTKALRRRSPSVGFFQSHRAAYRYGSFGGGVVGERGGLIERIQAMIFQLFLVVLIQIQALHYAYTAFGLTSTAALLLLLASLTGSYFNISSYFTASWMQVISV